MLPALPCEVDDRYTIIAELGHGSHAIVYRAVDHMRNCDVAIKVLRAELVNSDLSARFRREIRLTSQLDHPHIAHVYDSGELDGIPYFVSEIAIGETLATRLTRERQLSVNDALGIALDIASALSHAHDAGIIHRDVKPANTLLAQDGALLADFGVARALELMPGTLATSTGVAVGTLLYMSPEQLCAEKQIDARCDQYALALMLYEMLAGVPPHVSANAEGLRVLRITGQHAPVRAHRPSVPRAVDEALARALAPNPADRFRNVMEFAEAFTSRAASPEQLGANTLPILAASRRHGGHTLKIAAAVMLAAATVMAVRTATRMRAATASLLKPELSSIPVAYSVRLAVGSAQKDSAVSRALAAELRSWPTLQATANASSDDSGGTELQATVTTLMGGTLVRVRLRSDPQRSSSPRVVQVRLPDSVGIQQDSLRVFVARILMATLVSPDSAEALTTVTSRSVAAVREYALGWKAILRGEFEHAEEAFAASTLAGGVPQAALWRASVASWRKPSNVRVWQTYARSAIELASTLSRRDSLQAVALFTRSSGGDMQVACAAAKEAARIDGGSFAAWYGLAECLRSDSTVILDRASPTGARFQSSYWAATRAYEEAIARMPSAEIVTLFTTLPRVTLALNGTQRRGRSIAVKGESFAGLPSLTGDSVEIFPIQVDALAAGGKLAVPPSYQRAVARGRARLLELSRQLVLRAPGSVAAQLQFARALEYAGVLSAPAAEPSALSVLARASSIARTRGDSLDIGIATTRVHLRLGRFDDVRTESLRVLRFTPSASPDEAARLAPLAVLLGDTARAQALLMRTHAVSSIHPDGLPPHLAMLHAQYTVVATEGTCAPLVALRTRLVSALRSHYAAADLAVARESWLATGDWMQQTCVGAPRPEGAARKNLLANAFNAWRLADTAKTLQTVRRMLADRTGAAGSSVAWDTRVGEIWLLAQSGDAISARSRIRSALNDLEGTMDYAVSYLPQSAAFRQFLRICSDGSIWAKTDVTEQATCRRALAALVGEG